MKLLVVEDEALLRNHLQTRLTENGHVVEAVANAEEALYQTGQFNHDLAMIDLGLPGLGGLELIRELRNRGKTFPILILTARGNWQDKVEGLAAGADDYVAKPFKPAELVARVRARLRPGDVKAPETLVIGEISIDVAGHAVRRAGERISLTPLEFDLLVALARKPWQVFSRELLLEQVWGYRHAADTRLVNVHVQRLRSKIERDPEAPEVVLTVRGVGYKAGQ